jgi:hypothetical protein
MKNISLLKSLLVVVIIAPKLFSATSLEVSTSGKIEIVGTNSDVIGAGNLENFSTTPITLNSSYASFQMVLADGSNTRFADLRITPVSMKGTLDTTGGGSGLMIAQTSNSQGLVDTGTFSILTYFSSSDVNGVSSLTLRFDWFEPDSITPINISSVITSFDFDFYQFIKVSQSDYIQAAYGSALTQSFADGSTTWQSANSDSSFNNPNNAVILNTSPINSMLVEVGKVGGAGNSLFMFEFRDSSINLVPEPSGLILSLIGFVGLLCRRKR